MKARAGIGRGFSTPDPNVINRPGVFLMIPVKDLKVDSEYQRGITGNRVDRIKENWSWVAAGVITVALRGPGAGDYFVIDGQHRVAAAERAGISELPCLVFESVSHIDEAQGFLDANTSRKAMSVVDRYRALLVVRDPVALQVQALLAVANRVAALGGGANAKKEDARRILCLDYMMSAVSVDEETLEKIWPLVNDICDGRLITKRILQGLFYTERFLVNTSLLERHWRRRLLQVGYDGISKSIDETCAFEGKTGSAVCAAGVLRAVNRGLRNKLTMTVKSEAE